MIDKGSLKTVDASSKVTPCFSVFDATFEGSHSKRSAIMEFSNIEDALRTKISAV